MVSIDMRQTLQRASGLALALVLALAAAAGPRAGLSQPLSSSAAFRAQQITERVEQERSRNGPHSEHLIAPLTALALLYQEDGDRDLAAAAIEEALQVVRANFGLHSFEQAPLLEQAVDIEESRGDAEAAWDFEQELLSLVELNPDDLRSVAILHEIGDKRMDLLSRYYAGEMPPEIVLGCYYGRDCVAGSRGRVIRSIVTEAKSYYVRAVDTLLENGRYPSDEVEELLAKLVHSSYRYGNYSGVAPLLRRIVAYGAENSSSVPPLKRVEALVQAADWRVLLSNAVEPASYAGSAFALYGDPRERPVRESIEYDFGTVLALYEQAYEELEKDGADRASIEEIFSPKIPVVLPTVLPNPLISKETADSTGYIDVAFQITRRGKSRHVDVLDSTKNAPRAAKRDLVRLIKGSLFRPRMTNGTVTDSARLVVRYYLGSSAGQGSEERDAAEKGAGE